MVDSLKPNLLLVFDMLIQVARKVCSFSMSQV